MGSPRLFEHLKEEKKEGRQLFILDWDERYVRLSIVYYDKLTIRFQTMEEWYFKLSFVSVVILLG